jgi:hypothetical protein
LVVRPAIRSTSAIYVSGKMDIIWKIISPAENVILNVRIASVDQNISAHPAMVII